MLVNYDFELLRADRPAVLYTGAITRRFIAAIIDGLVIALLVISFSLAQTRLVGHQFHEGSNALLVMVLLAWLVLPELLWRQTVGMWLMGLVTVVPPPHQPFRAILVRKAMNVLEFMLPNVIYYCVVGFRQEHRSFSDEVSGCLVVSKRHLLGHGTKRDAPSRFALILTVVVFAILGSTTVIMFALVLLAMLMGALMFDAFGPYGLIWP